MAGYYKGGFGKLRAGVTGGVRLRASLSPVIIPPTPVAGGFYVSPTGSDVTNGSSDMPFATIARAITATRAGSEKRIFLRGGVHRLTSKIVLSSTDKGMSISSYPGEVPIVSGAEKLTGFTDIGDGVYTKALAQPSGLDLSVGGVRQRPAQIGSFDPANPYRSGWLIAIAQQGNSLFTNEFTTEFESSTVASSSSFGFFEGDIPQGIFTPNLMVQVFDAGRLFDHISYVSNINYATREISMVDPHPFGAIGAGATYRLLNHQSFIGRNGEFAWNVAESKIVVRPGSSDFETKGVYLPLLDGLFELQAGADDVTFLGVTFADSLYGGYAISATESHQLRVGRCIFKNVGGGIRATDCVDGKVAGCEFSDLASNGILLNSGSSNWKIYSNKFNKVGAIKKNVAALFSQGAESATFAFNEVQYSPRHGVTFKGGGSHRVLYNTIKDAANETADGAVIEFVGGVSDQSSLVEGIWIDRAPGYPISSGGEFSDEFNSIEFSVATESPRTRSALVSLNDLASGVTVRGNLTRAASVGHFVVDGGDRNVFENNISILDQYDEFYASVRANTTLSGSDLNPDTNSFRRNVVHSTINRSTNPWQLIGLGAGNVIDSNIYYNSAKAVGHDSLSVTADPKFLGIASDNFKFDSTSPALSLGISQLAFDSMGLKGYTQTSSLTYGLDNFHGATLDPGTVDPGTGFTVQTSKVENYDTITSWEGQELTVGLMFVKGDVQTGQIIVAVVDGKDVPYQLNHRINWPDGSLRTATASWEMPAIAAGQAKDVVWTRRNGTWNNTPKHTATTAITGKVSLEYAFTSWKGRNAANTLTEERGPKYFRSADMLASSNSVWIEQTMSGPVMTEWRTSAFAKKGDSTTDPNFACWLYVRAWGGTANNPKRIQFLFRTMHSWTDNSVPADESGLRCDMDLKVGSTVVRGKTLSTVGWSARDGFKGGFYASCGANGKMDWLDSSNGSMLTPPNLLVRHDYSYGLKTKFFPPFDVNNPSYTASASIDYVPQGRGTLRFQQDETGDDDGNIPWHTNRTFVKSLIAHARRPALETATQDRISRVNAWGIGAMGNIGYNKDTRKLHCYLPPERNPNPTALGPSVYNNTKPTVTDGALNPYIKARDNAHFPQMTWWTALTEGETHMRDLAMAEAALPGTLEAPAYGFYGTLLGLKFGHGSHSGQNRAVGQTYRPMLMASVLADPQDPNGQLAKALLDMQLDVVKLVPASQDAWRGGTTLQDNHMLHPPSGNEPNYKLWMHLFASKALTYAAPLLDDPKVTEQAHWWMWLPIVLAGGWKNDSDPLMKPDPFNVSYYTHLCMSGPGPNAQAKDRQAWKPGQWAREARPCDYMPDGQTVTMTAGANAANGMLYTVTGVHKVGEPPEVTDFTKQPVGLSRWIAYYAVQSNGLSCKLSLTQGGAPVTFDTGGATIRGMVARSNVNGVTPLAALGTVTGSGIASYFKQAMVALDMYQHYLAPNDARVKLARNQLKAINDADNVQGGFDVRGKTTVPY